MDEQKHDGVTDGAELVLGLMSLAPSAPFLLKRFQADGTLKEFPIRIRILRKTEMLAALAEAQSLAKKIGETDAKYGDIYRECQATTILVRSLCKDELIEPKDGSRAPYYRQLFVSAQQLHDSLTDNEIAQCLNALEITKAKFSAIESFDADEIDKWAARLSDEVLGPLFLSHLASDHWPVLLTSLAQEVSSLRESLGRPLPSLLDSLASPRASSESGTGGSTVSLSERSNGQPSEPVPTPPDRLLSKQEAQSLAKKRRK